MFNEDSIPEVSLDESVSRLQQSDAGQYALEAFCNVTANCSMPELLAMKHLITKYISQRLETAAWCDVENLRHRCGSQARARFDRIQRRNCGEGSRLWINAMNGLAKSVRARRRVLLLFGGRSSKGSPGRLLFLNVGNSLPPFSRSSCSSRKPIRFDHD